MVNLIITITAGGYGFVIKSMWDSLKNLDTQVGNLQVSVAGEYLKREEWKQDMQRLFDKLDAIDEKLDGKADK
ncbi:MAG: hypothetical protein VW715_02485 [Rhodospirillales bacterium]